jgi:hypothetical protein
MAFFQNVFAGRPLSLWEKVRVRAEWTKDVRYKIRDEE